MTQPSSRRSGYKKVDSFHFKHEGFERDFDIYMRKDTRSGFSGIRTFWVFADDLEMVVSDESIDAVERKARAEITKRLSTSWEMFLMVRTHGSSNYQVGESYQTVSLASSLSIEVEIVELGTHHDGSKVHRKVIQTSDQENLPAEMRKERIQRGWPDTGPVADEWMQRRYGQGISLIPFTQEKHQQILELLSRLSGLREALKHALSQELIEKMLTTFSSHALMPAEDNQIAGTLIEARNSAE